MLLCDWPKPTWQNRSRGKLVDILGEVYLVARKWPVCERPFEVVPDLIRSFHISERALFHGFEFRENHSYSQPPPLVQRSRNRCSPKNAVSGLSRGLISQNTIVLKDIKKSELTPSFESIPIV